MRQNIMANKKRVLNPKTDGNEYLFPRDVDPDQDEDGSFEDTGTRVVEVADYKYTISSSDPYGFWSIKPSNGRLPTELEGQFTGQFEAERAIEAYVAKQSLT